MLPLKTLSYFSTRADYLHNLFKNLWYGMVDVIGAVAVAFTLVC